jgi:hypothetical protein
MQKVSPPRKCSAVKTAWASPERGFLLDVGYRDPPAAAVAHGVADLLVGVAHHDPDLPDAGRRQGLDAIEEDGLVGDRDELLRRGVGDGAKPGSPSSGED